MTTAEFKERKASMLKPGEWTEVFIEDEFPFFKRQFFCGDCGESNTYGMTPYCPYCGMRKRVAGILGGKP